MKFNFDNLIERTGTHSVKWDHFDMKGEVEGMIPMSIADMDFHVPPFITDALEKRVSHGIFGYTVMPASYYEALERWLEERFACVGLLAFTLAGKIGNLPVKILITLLVTLAIFFAGYNLLLSDPDRSELRGLVRNMARYAGSESG